MNINGLTPQISFYFVRHGQTDWNKFKQGLCAQDDIALNDMGLQQAENAASILVSSGITKIYSSPLTRAMQTTEIINRQIKVPLETHNGLYATRDEIIVYTLNEILSTSYTSLIVSHGEVYRILLRILNAQTNDSNAKNGGVYFFKAPDEECDHWSVYSIDG